MAIIYISGATNDNFRKISVRKTICDLEFSEHFIVKFLACLTLLGFSGAFFLAQIFEKVSFDPYNFRITRLSARKSEQMKSF